MVDILEWFQNPKYRLLHRRYKALIKFSKMLLEIPNGDEVGVSLLAPTECITTKIVRGIDGKSFTSEIHISYPGE